MIGMRGGTAMSRSSVTLLGPLVEPGNGAAALASPLNKIQENRLQGDPAGVVFRSRRRKLRNQAMELGESGWVIYPERVDHGPSLRYMRCGIRCEAADVSLLLGKVPDAGV